MLDSVRNEIYQFNAGTDAWTQNINAEPIIGGALMGAGAILFAPSVVALAGDALVGVGVVTGSTAVFGTGTAMYGVATTMEVNIAFGSPFRVVPTFRYNPATTSEIIDADYAAQANGRPSVLTYRADRNANLEAGREARKGYPTISGFDRHEYPYASTYEGGSGSQITYVDSGQNSRHGNYLANFYERNDQADGFRFFVDTGYWRWTSWPASTYTSAVQGVCHRRIYED